MAFDPITHWGITLNDYAIKSAPVPSIDSKGYDTASMLIIWRGGYEALLDEFARGDESMPDVPVSSRMFCQGIIGKPESKFGGIWAEIGWTGYYVVPSLASASVGLYPTSGSGNLEGIRGFATSVTGEDIEFPQDVNGVPVFLGTDMLPAGKSVTNTDSSTYWRARVIDDVYIRTYYGTTIATPSTPPDAPRCNAVDPVTGSDPINWTDGGGAGARAIRRVNWWPGKTTAGAWVRKDFQCQMDHIFGPVALYSWTATYEWRQQYSI